MCTLRKTNINKSSHILRGFVSVIYDRKHEFESRTKTIASGLTRKKKNKKQRWGMRVGIKIM
jgi:hypothetical protein